MTKNNPFNLEPDDHFSYEMCRFEKPEKIIHKALHEEITLRFEALENKQKIHLDKIWPKWEVEEDLEKLKSILNLLARTLAKNKVGR